MPTTPELDAALVAAAQALPAHFSNADDLTIEGLDAIQATTMSLPGGAFAVESVVQGNDTIGSVVLIITGLVDHKNGEVFDRTEARTLWTAALEESFTALQGEVGEFKTGQAHMTDPFDVLESADEAAVAGVFSEQTLAALLLAQPKEATGQGAAAELAAAIAAAEAEDTAADEDAEGTAAEAEDGAEGSTADDAAGDDGEGIPEFTPSPDSAGMTPAGAPTGAPPAGMPGAPGMPGMPGYDPYAGFAPGAYPPPGYPPYGYAAPPQDPEQAAAAAAAAAARAQANMNLPGMPTPTLSPFAPGGYVDPRRIDLLREVLMGVSVELGRTRLTVSEILGLTPGSVVELDRAAGAPVDVLVNGTLIAHGEVVVVDEEFAVRISEVIDPQAGGEGRASA
ncbi:flagellar motor switch protein FliN [Mobilicoccus pelagius]|uniref:Flagellar motor switch protein FliN-like C-terminal domain-containing protein n=1 Tax=Mobilicoccus pelagius NBRC 104925 TaxID=1089455 RepID=H5UQY9_9MICO|nr:flagellar motor switch protein FliN [Mobilicoccus pelagius]GAB48147.1 hypothetical protein MOPEL_060_00640 [Mobilicoccus pelagius NBRC 104925]